MPLADERECCASDIQKARRAGSTSGDESLSLSPSPSPHRYLPYAYLKLHADFVMAMVGEVTKEPPPTVATTRRRGRTAGLATAVSGEVTKEPSPAAATTRRRRWTNSRAMVMAG